MLTLPKPSAPVAAFLIVMGAWPAQAADPTPVADAERAFAARALEAGVPRSFLDFMADDAIVFAPEPTSAKALYSSRLPGKSPGQGGPRLVWWPRWAGLAASQDLGFTTGPAEVNGKRHGYYFTVWKRQPDGRWRWVYDGAVDSDATGELGPEAPVAPLAASTVAPMTADEAIRQVRAAEAELAGRAAADLPSAYRPVLAQDTRMVGSPAPPAHVPEALEAELAYRPTAAAFRAMGGEASSAGDLAWTYGEIRWTEGGGPARGHYVRVWQRRPEGWRLVYDQWRQVKPPAPKPQQ